MKTPSRKTELPHYDDDETGRDFFCARAAGFMYDGHQIVIGAASHELIEIVARQLGFKVFCPERTIDVMVFKDHDPPPPEDYFIDNDELLLRDLESPDDEDIFASAGPPPT